MRKGHCMEDFFEFTIVFAIIAVCVASYLSV